MTNDERLKRMSVTVKERRRVYVVPVQIVASAMDTMVKNSIDRDYLVADIND